MDKDETSDLTEEIYDEPVREHANKHKKKANFLQKKRDDGLLLLLNDPQARCYLNSLLEFCGVFRMSYAGNSNQTCFNEGQRNVGLQIFADITRVDEAKILTLFQENKEDSK